MLSVFLLWTGSFMIAVIYTVHHLKDDSSDSDGNSDDSGGNKPEDPNNGIDPPINIDFTEQKSDTCVDVLGNIVKDSNREKVTA